MFFLRGDIFLLEFGFLALSLPYSWGKADVKHYLLVPPHHSFHITVSTPADILRGAHTHVPDIKLLMKYLPDLKGLLQSAQSLEAHQTSPVLRLCHVSEEGHFLQFGIGELKAISVCISVSVDGSVSAFFFHVCWEKVALASKREREVAHP